MIRSLINAVAILIGAGVGMLLKRFLTNSVKDAITQSLGLVVVVIGISMAIETKNTLLLLSTVIAGGVLGEIVGIQQGFERIGDKIKSSLGKLKVNEAFTEGFVNGIIFFCLGILGVIGAIEFSLNNDPSVFYSKAIIDGVIAISLTSSFGIGCVFAAGFMVVYQGLLCVFAGFLAPVLSPEIVNEISAAGGIIIVGAGLGILKMLNIRPVNLLPALVLILVYGAGLF